MQPRNISWQVPFSAHAPRAREEFKRHLSWRSWLRIGFATGAVWVVIGLVLEKWIPGFEMQWLRDFFIMVGAAVLLVAYLALELHVPPKIIISPKGITEATTAGGRRFDWEKIREIKIESAAVPLPVLTLVLPRPRKKMRDVDHRTRSWPIAPSIDTGELAAAIERHWAGKVQWVPKAAAPDDTGQ